MSGANIGEISQVLTVAGKEVVLFFAVLAGVGLAEAGFADTVCADAEFPGDGVARYAVALKSFWPSSISTRWLSGTFSKTSLSNVGQTTETEILCDALPTPKNNSLVCCEANPEPAEINFVCRLLSHSMVT